MHFINLEKFYIYNARRNGKICTRRFQIPFTFLFRKSLSSSKVSHVDNLGEGETVETHLSRDFWIINNSFDYRIR